MSKLTRKQLLERADWRDIAIGAARARLRQCNIEPRNAGWVEMCEVLEAQVAEQPDTIAAGYVKKYLHDEDGGEAEWGRFKKAWRKHERTNRHILWKLRIQNNMVDRQDVETLQAARNGEEKMQVC